MASGTNAKKLKLIVPRKHHRRIDKLVENTRHFSVSNEYIWVSTQGNNNLSGYGMQDSIIYTWNFHNDLALENKKSELSSMLNKEYITEFHLLVS